MEQSVLNFFNTLIRGEHGNRVTMESKWIDSGVDSFGTTMIFSDLDEKYKCFPKEWFHEHIGRWNQLTVREIVERVINEGTIV